MLKTPWSRSVSVEVHIFSSCVDVSIYRCMCMCMCLIISSCGNDCNLLVIWHLREIFKISYKQEFYSNTKWRLVIHLPRYYTRIPGLFESAGINDIGKEKNLIIGMLDLLDWKRLGDTKHSTRNRSWIKKHPLVPNSTYIVRYQSESDASEDNTNKYCIPISKQGETVL